MDVGDNPLTKVIESLPAIPAASKPGLIRGLSYLLGGLGNYLGAWLRRPVQAIEDRTDARTVITHAIALSAAEKLAADPSVISAAIAQWGPADLNRQLNKMRIAQEVIKEIAYDKPDSDQPERSSEPPSEDFLNSFERFCADSTDEKMQKLWARLLAGEIKRPGSFSRHTMRCLYELDSEVARVFEKVAMRTIGGVLLYDTDDDIKTHEINKLQTAGLITGGGGVYNYTFEFNDSGVCALKCDDYILSLKDGSGNFTLTSYPLSQAGTEMLLLLPDYDERHAINKLMDQIPVNKAADISITPYSDKSGALTVGPVEQLRPDATDKTRPS